MRMIRYIYDSLSTLVGIFIGVIAIILFALIGFSIFPIVVLVVEQSLWYIFLVIPYAVTIKYMTEWGKKK
jgi:hypothetical protein